MQHFRATCVQAEAVLFAVPEYAFGIVAELAAMVEALARRRQDRSDAAEAALSA